MFLFDRLNRNCLIRDGLLFSLVVVFSLFLEYLGLFLVSWVKLSALKLLFILNIFERLLVSSVPVEFVIKLVLSAPRSPVLHPLNLFLLPFLHLFRHITAHLHASWLAVTRFDLGLYKGSLAGKRSTICFNHSMKGKRSRTSLSLL